MSITDVNDFLSGFGGCELTLYDLLGLDSEFLIDSMDELLQQKQPEQHAEHQPEHHIFQLDQTPLHELDNLEFMLDLSDDLLQEQLFEPAQSEHQEPVCIVLEGDEEKKIHPFFNQFKKKRVASMYDQHEHKPKQQPDPAFIILGGHEVKKIYPFFKQLNKKKDFCKYC
jgi:hypothetical protein